MSKRPAPSELTQATSNKRNTSLLVPVAKYGRYKELTESLTSFHERLQDITPERYGTLSAEAMNRVKSQEYVLVCPDMHKLCYRKNSCSGTRRAHFAHVNTCFIGKCNYLTKYGGLGETQVHLQRKLWFGEQITPIVFHMKCSQGCGNDIKTFEVERKWMYVTEYKLPMGDGRSIWVDGAFLDDGQVKLVVEVKHSNSTKGGKLNWLQLQENYEFFEVDALEGYDGHHVTIINQKDDVSMCSICKLDQTIEQEETRLSCHVISLESEREARQTETQQEKPRLKRMPTYFQTLNPWRGF